MATSFYHPASAWTRVSDTPATPADPDGWQLANADFVADLAKANPYPKPAQRQDMAIAATRSLRLKQAESIALKHVLHRAGAEKRACWQSQPDMAADCGMGVTTLARALKSITRRRLVFAQGRFQDTTVYHPNFALLSDLLAGLQISENSQFGRIGRTGELTGQFGQFDRLTGKELERGEERVSKESFSPSLSVPGSGLSGQIDRIGPVDLTELDSATVPKSYDKAYLKRVWAELHQFQGLKFEGAFINHYKANWCELPSALQSFLDARDFQEAEAEAEAQEASEREARQLAQAQAREAERQRLIAERQAAMTPDQRGWWAASKILPRYFANLARDVLPENVTIEASALILPFRTEANKVRWDIEAEKNNAPVLALVQEHLPQVTSIVTTRKLEPVQCRICRNETTDYGNDTVVFPFEDSVLGVTTQAIMACNPCTAKRQEWTANIPAPPTQRPGRIAPPAEVGAEGLTDWGSGRNET